jgi:hypothetical protein
MRNRLGRVLLVAGVAAALVGVRQGYAAAPKSATFDLMIVDSGPQGQVTITSKVWLTATQARAEVKHPLGGSSTLLISAGHIYQLDPKKKRGVRSKLPKEMAASKDNFAFLMTQFGVDSRPVVSGGKKVKTEKVAGYTCDVYERKSSKNGRSLTARVWMPQKMDPKFAVKAVADTSVKKPGLTARNIVTFTLSNIKLNQTIAAATFAVPTGFQIKDVQLPAQPPKG